MSTYAIANRPIPVYSTIRPDPTQLELICFPKTKFTIIKEVTPTIVQITTQEYPSKKPLYVDRRFLIAAGEETPEREKLLPTAQTILDFMTSKIGTRYLWGGNWATGISEMQEFYLEEPVTDDLLCKGVDCSGLLYQATNGFTPRNTSDLCNYGIEIKDPAEVKPLDMMVWEGHVIFVLNSTQCIESFGGRGVIVSDFMERYEFFKDKQFTLRRWHPNFLT